MSIYTNPGGPDKPYPFNHLCWQGCNLGPQYAHASSSGTVSVKFPITDFGSGSGFPQYSTAGFYPPQELYVSPSGTQIGGQYWAGYYSITSGVGTGTGGALPTTAWTSPQALLSIVVPVGGTGTGYTTGTLTATGGILIFNGTGATQIAIVASAGKIVSATILVPGEYLPGHLPTGWSGGGSGEMTTKTWGNATMNLDGICQKRGFKGVAAQRQWQGIFGFKERAQSVSGTAPISAVCYTPGTPGPTITAAVGLANLTPPTTKYRTYNISVGTTSTNGAGGFYTGTHASNFTVNASSGETTGSGSSSYTGSPSPDPMIYGNGAGQFYSCLGNPLEWLKTCDYNGAAAKFSGFIFSGSYCTGTTSDQKLWETVELSSGTVDVLIEEVTLTLGSTLTATRKRYSYYGTQTYNPVSGMCDLTGMVSYLVADESLTMDNTSVNYSLTSYAFTGTSGTPPTCVSTGSTSVYGTISITAGLADALTSATVYADCVSLLNYWNLSDDLQHPWRTDGYCSILPKMSRNEIGPIEPLVNYDTGGAYVDGNVRATIAGTTYLVYDGSILGAPNAAGYINTFSFPFQFMDSGFLTTGYGSDVLDLTSTGVQIPANATQWTNGQDAAGIGPGASIVFADMPAGPPNANNATIRCVKWAQIVEKWPAQNWNYAGNAKFYIDEARVFCVSAATGSNLTLATPITGGTSGIWAYVNAGAIDGFYTISGSGTAITLAGSKSYNAPSNWDTVYKARGFPDTGSYIAPVRLISAPSLSGRVAITMASTTATFSGAQPNFGMNVSGVEYVDVWDANMNALAANVAATRVNDTTFTMTNYPTAAWVTIHGDPNPWYMNSGYPRGNFVTLEWVTNNRVIGETARLTGATDCSGSALPLPTPLGGVGYVSSFGAVQHCLSNIGCAPRVVCWSPNGETFGNGIKMGFTAPAFDQVYGCAWYGAVMDTMTDEYWQSPHNPPCDGTPLNQDDGSCNPANNYCLEPIVEAELAPPGYGIGGGESVSYPGFITVGVVSPIASMSGILPPAPGSPAGAWTTRTLLMANAAGCSTFDYGWFLP